MVSTRGEWLIKVFMFIAIAILCSIPIFAENISVKSGNVYYAELEGNFGTQRWAGMKITHNAIELSESNTPFLTGEYLIPIITSTQFPGFNMKDDNHYYGAMKPTNFDASKLENITVSDLNSEELFDSTSFPMFYPNYDDYNDNPYKTFCCDQENIKIAGDNFTAFKITQNQNVNYYLLKYNDNGDYQPLFLVNIKDQTCFNSSSCVSQFMLPVPSNYSFYALSKRPSYNYTVWIDGVKTNTFSQTAQPYNLTVEVRDLYTSALINHTDIAVIEENGQNIFIPYRLSGYITQSHSIGQTSDTGKETFVVAPTVYPSTVDNYSIYLSVLFDDDTLANKEQLYITSKDQIVQSSKPLSPQLLYDNSKTAVNAMNQINNFLFKWSSQMLQAKKFILIYDTATGNFTESDLLTSATNITLKTGAPNVISAYLNNGGIPSSGYIKIKEQNGYLVMNPTIANSGLLNKTRKHYQRIPTGTEFIITPTSLGVTQSNITIEIYDSGGSLLNSKDININPSLNIETGGLFYNNDLLKTIVNAMNQVIYSLYYSLNY